jgi:hypothetical protein
MKYTIALLLFTLISCSKSEVAADSSGPTQTNNMTDGGAVNTTGKKLLFEGSFTNGAHPTSGKAGIYQDDMGEITLVFDNFKTDAGPDLRIYMAEDKSVSNFIEITNKVENGNKSYVLPKTWDSAKQRQVLIWCKQFSVLFGSAELKAK